MNREGEGTRTTADHSQVAHRLVLGFEVPPTHLALQVRGRHICHVPSELLGGMEQLEPMLKFLTSGLRQMSKIHDQDGPFCGPSCLTLKLFEKLLRKGEN